MTRIKLCGLTRKEDILTANELMPDHIGFVLWEKSRRYVRFEKAKELKELLDLDIVTKEEFEAKKKKLLDL